VHFLVLVNLIIHTNGRICGTCLIVFDRLSVLVHYLITHMDVFCGSFFDRLLVLFLTVNSTVLANFSIVIFSFVTACEDS
jgi:hypothetical protein